MERLTLEDYFDAESSSSAGLEPLDHQTDGTRPTRNRHDGHALRELSLMRYHYALTKSFQGKAGSGALASTLAMR